MSPVFTESNSGKNLSQTEVPWLELPPFSKLSGNFKQNVSQMFCPPTKSCSRLDANNPAFINYIRNSLEIYIRYISLNTNVVSLKTFTVVNYARL